MADASPGPRRRWPWVVAGLLAIVLLAGVATALWWTSRDTGPTHPDTWDPRVEKIVRFVENERDRDFHHPVTVRFLGDTAYRERITGSGSDGGGPTAQDRRSAADGLAEQRALGILNGKVDPFKASDDLVADGSLAFYDPETQEVLVKGTKLTVGTRVTLAHELTHALQDQVVGLDKIEAADSEDGQAAMHTLTEGDATNVEDAYIATLDDEDYRAYADENDAASSGAKGQLDDKGVPAAWQAGFGLPYSYGPSFVKAVIDDGGNEALWGLYSKQRLQSSLPVVDLLADAHTRVTDVKAPKPAKGAKEISTDTIGPFEWMVPLAEYTDGDTVRQAIAGWRGDSVLVSKGRSGVVCVDANIALADADGASTFAAAVARWLSALPAQSKAGSTRDGTTIRLHTCDPGEKVDVPLTGRAERNLAEPALRNQIATEVASGPDISLQEGFCFADGLIARYGFDTLLGDTAVTDEPGYPAVAKQVAEGCGLTFNR